MIYNIVLISGVPQTHSTIHIHTLGFSGVSDGKISAWNAGDLDLWVGKIHWRREWQPTPVFLPGKSHGQRSLAGCSPQGGKELDTVEQPTVFRTVTGWN